MKLLECRNTAQPSPAFWCLSLNEAKLWEWKWATHLHTEILLKMLPVILRTILAYIWAKFNCLSQWEWKWGLFHNVWNRYLKGHTAYVWLYKTISMHDSFTLELAEFFASVIFVVNLITVWNVYYNKAENYWLNMQKYCNWIQNCTHKTQRETSNAREATQKKMFLITALICTDKARTKIHKNTLLCQLSCLHCKYYRNMQGS